MEYFQKMNYLFLNKYKPTFTFDYLVYKITNLLLELNDNLNKTITNIVKWYFLYWVFWMRTLYYWEWSFYTNSYLWLGFTWVLLQPISSLTTILVSLFWYYNFSFKTIILVVYLPVVWQIARRLAIWWQ